MYLSIKGNFRIKCTWYFLKNEHFEFLNMEFILAYLREFHNIQVQEKELSFSTVKIKFLPSSFLTLTLNLPVCYIDKLQVSFNWHKVINWNQNGVCPSSEYVGFQSCLRLSPTKIIFLVSHLLLYWPKRSTAETEKQKQDEHLIAREKQ